MLELIVNKEKDIENIMLVENGRLVENYITTEEERKRRQEGNIYAGKIGDIINGMQAAFVDYGEEKKGFIHLKDLIPQEDESKEKKDIEVDIKSVIKQGQKILVQVKKDSDNTKGARLSTHISLPGKFVVILPNSKFITISQKIEDEHKKNELIEFVKGRLPKEIGAIIRTASIDASKQEIQEDIETLLKKWKQIQEKFKNIKNVPKLILKEEDIEEKIITDLNTKGLQKIITNNKEIYNKFKQNPKTLKLEIVLEENQDLFSKYDLNNQIEKRKHRKIWLNCGGCIIIDRTEALTAIDVNTGKYTGKSDLESTIFTVNKEATIEIAKQLRLRDIGGIIIIDYIDMRKEENKEKIQQLLEQELKKDRAKTQIEGFTKLNLLEMTRKHICSHLNEIK